MQRTLIPRVPSSPLTAILGLCLALPCLALLCLALPCLALPSLASQGLTNIQYHADSLQLDILQPNRSSTLTVAGPGGTHWKQTFEQGEPVSFHLRNAAGELLQDGSYTFELHLAPLLDEEAKAALQQARWSGDMTQVQALQATGRLPQEANVVSGSFTVDQGRILDPLLEEEPAASAPEALLAGASGDSSGGGLTNTIGFDQVIADDLIVDGSACVGFDCANGESFGSDTIKLKENSLRIFFDDTSNQPFPANDWRLVANDSNSGGLEKFSIEDSSNGRTPFTIEAGAKSHSLYVDDGGRIGVGTSTPSVELHVLSGETPNLRLDQNGSAGFAPQVWDVAGNETNFFIRDSSNGSTLPFRIRPGADTNSIYIGSDSHVGIGTANPIAALHVAGSDGNTSFTVDENSPMEQARSMLTLENNGRVLWLMRDTSANGTTWRFRTVEGQFNFDSDVGPGNEFVLDSSGNLTILGMLTQNSNREAKTNIEAIDADEVLRKVAQLPLSTWTYKKEQEVEHLGPMAQDFYDAFGLGASNTGITTYDTAGVALASVQALYLRLQEQERLNAALVQRLEALEEGRSRALEE